MKIFVTGGAGFIGTNLCKSLQQERHLVTIFDNLSNSSIKNMKNLKSENIQFVEGDILNQKKIKDESVGFDIVIHLAAQISVQESIKNPEYTIKNNLDGTKNVFNACLENKIKNIIVVSSASIFGNECREKDTLNEETNCKPLSPYGSSKLDMENWLKENIKDVELNCIILRFFNIYGIGQTKEYAGVISKFAGCIKNNSKITIYGDGKQTRDFISIDDIVKSINLSISNIDNKKAEIYNIGTGISTSINELAELMLKISDGKNKIYHTDGKNKIYHTDPKNGDIRFSKTSIKKVQKDLNFDPKISLKDGIKKYWDSF